MPTVACDSKHFERGRREYSDQSEDYFAFRTPLGIAAWFKDDNAFHRAFVSTTNDLAKSFRLESNRPFFSSELLKEKLGMEKAIAFADQLVTAVSKFIGGIHVTFVVLPPKQFPTVSVLGYRSTSKEIPTELFFESLGPMFSYLTAFSFLGKPENDSREWTVLIDSFKSKSTQAWSDLTKRIQPRIFIRGDECNPFICFADLVAFLTDCKLYSHYLKLSFENLVKVYEGYPFDVKVHWFDKEMLSKIKWYDDSLIDFSKYLARPITYLLIDPVDRYFQTDIRTSPYQAAEQNESPESDQVKPEKFRDFVERSDIFDAALTFAYRTGGCAKVYTPEDAKLIKDGDILVYIGNKAKDAAETFSHMREVKVLSGKDLRREALRA